MNRKIILVFSIITSVLAFVGYFLVFHPKNIKSVLQKSEKSTPAKDVLNYHVNRKEGEKINLGGGYLVDKSGIFFGQKKLLRAENFEFFLEFPQSFKTFDDAAAFVDGKYFITEYEFNPNMFGLPTDATEINIVHFDVDRILFEYGYQNWVSKYLMSLDRKTGNFDVFAKADEYEIYDHRYLQLDKDGATYLTRSVFESGRLAKLEKPLNLESAFLLSPTRIIEPNCPIIRDNENVFFREKIISDNPKSFVLYQSDYIHSEDTPLMVTYSKDNKNVFVGCGNRIENADPSTFWNLGEGYAKDKNFVYFNGNLLEGKDPKSFHLP